MNNEELDKKCAEIMGMIHTVCGTCKGYGFMWTNAGRIRVTCSTCKGIQNQNLLKDKKKKIEFSSQKSSDDHQNIEIIRLNDRHTTEWSPSTRWDHAGILIEWVAEKVKDKNPNELPYELLATDGLLPWWKLTPRKITEWFVEVFGEKKHLQDDSEFLYECVRGDHYPGDSG